MAGCETSSVKKGQFRQSSHQLSHTTRRWGLDFPRIKNSGTLIHRALSVDNTEQLNRGYVARQLHVFREARSGGSDLVEQIGVTIQHLEQLHQGQRRLCLTILVAGKGINAAAEDFGGFALVKRELLAHAGDEGGIDGGRIHLLGEGAHYSPHSCRVMFLEPVVKGLVYAGLPTTTSSAKGSNDGFV